MREAECAAANECGVVGEKVREVMEEMRSGICLVLKEDQYLDSAVCFGVRGLGLCLGFTGYVLEIWGSAIEGAQIWSVSWWFLALGFWF